MEQEKQFISGKNQFDKLMINQRLIVLSPTVPPGVCGASEFSFNVAKSLRNFYKSLEIAVESVPGELSPSHVDFINVSNWQDCLRRLSKPSEASDLLFNYTPTSYSKAGFPITLIAALKKFKQANSKNRLFVIVHETWNGSSNLRFHHMLRDKLSKWSVTRIGKLSDGITVLTEEQKTRLSTVLPDRLIQICLVGTHISPVNQQDGLESVRHRGVWIVFGLSHTRLWTLKTHLTLINFLHKHGIIKEIRSVGPSNDLYASQEMELINKNIGTGILSQLGVLSLEEISAQMLHAEAGLIGQNSDSLRKSSSFMALTAHALPVICEVPVSLLEPPGKLLFRPEELYSNPNFITSPEGENRRRLLYQWFWSTRSWEVIGKDIHNWMNQ